MMQGGPETPLWAQTATEIAARVRSGETSAEAVARSHLDRIAKVNSGINAIVQEFPEAAIAEARAVDARRASGGDPGPLAGVPVTIKVNVDQKGQATTNGLRLQADLVAGADSPVVANLRRAGAVIVGRTNTPAFSMRWFTNSRLHGQTLNPRNRALTPGGSSGGAAAAVAAGLCAIGHGTDIAGSIRYPAFACGIHGLRPSLGRIPARNGSAPDRMLGAQLMAVSGPMARSIADLRLGFAAMAAGDAADPWWMPVPHDLGPFPRRAALAVAPDGMAVAPQVQVSLRAAAEALAQNGWEVEEVAPPPLRPAAEINAGLWMAEARAAADLIEAEGDAEAQFVFARMTEDAPEMDLAALQGVVQARVGQMRAWLEFLEDWPVLICPSSGEAPFAQLRDVRSSEDFAAIMEAQLIQRALPALGLPGLAVATGAYDGAPMGVQLVASKYREDILFDAGQTLENVFGAPGPELQLT